MDALDAFFGSAFFLLAAVLLYGIPIFLIVWFMRTMRELRDGQRRLLQVVSAIHTELREQAAREYWNQNHR